MYFALHVNLDLVDPIDDLKILNGMRNEPRDRNRNLFVFVDVRRCLWQTEGGSKRLCVMSVRNTFEFRIRNYRPP